MVKMKRYAPLPMGFMITSILGFMISVFWIKNVINETWAFTFGLFFLVLFFASFISMRRADPDAQLKM